MALLDQLDRQESDRLWWKLHRAVNHTADEIVALARCRKTTREQLYGPGILEAAVAMLGDLEDVLEIDLALGTYPAAPARVEPPTKEG